MIDLTLNIHPIILLMLYMVVGGGQHSTKHRAPKIGCQLICEHKHTL